MTNLPDNQANYQQPEVIEADWWQPLTGSELAEQPTDSYLQGQPPADFYGQSGASLGQPFSNLPAGQLLSSLPPGCHVHLTVNSPVAIDNRTFSYVVNSHNSVANSHNTSANYKLAQTTYRRTSYKRQVYTRKPSQLVWPLVFWAWFISVGLVFINQLSQPSYQPTPSQQERW